MLLAVGLTLLLGSMLALTVVNAVLVDKLREQHRNLYEDLDRPSPFYFVGIQWALSGKFVDFVWSDAATRLGNRMIQRCVWSIRTCTLLVLLALIFLTAYQFS